MTEASAAPDTDAYARLYEREHPRLVAYARSLTGNPWVAEDLVAEAHFRVWRRLHTGHQIDNVSAYLTTTVRHLSSANAGHSAREIPQDPATAAEDRAGPDERPANQDPAQRIAHVDLLARVMGQLPERWVKALWLAEAEDQPLETVGRQIGANSGATAVLLHRAREGMRQAFLREHPGTPDDPACAVHWERMPAHVRGTDSPRQAESMALHADACTDCRDRLALLAQANTRLPALVGPALLVLFAGGGAKFLAPLFGAGAAAGVGAGAGAAGGQAPTPGAAGSLRHVLRGQVGQAGPVAATVAGLGVLVVAGVAVAAGLSLSGSDGGGSRAQAPAVASSAAPDRTPAQVTPEPGTAPEPGATGPAGTGPGRRPGGDRPAAPDRPQSATPPAAPTAAAPGPGRSQPPAPATPDAPTGPTRSSEPTAATGPTEPAGPPAPTPPRTRPAPQPSSSAATRPSTTPQRPTPPRPKPTPPDLPTPTPTPDPTEPTPGPTEPTPTPPEPTPEPTPTVEPTAPTPEPTGSVLICKPLLPGVTLCWYG